MHCLAIVYCPSLSNFPPLTYKDWLACQQTRSSREAGWILEGDWCVFEVSPSNSWRSLSNIPLRQVLEQRSLNSTRSKWFKGPWFENQDLIYSRLDSFRAWNIQRWGIVKPCSDSVTGGGQRDRSIHLLTSISALRGSPTPPLSRNSNPGPASCNYMWNWKCCAPMMGTVPQSFGYQMLDGENWYIISHLIAIFMWEIVRRTHGNVGVPNFGTNWFWYFPWSNQDKWKTLVR